MNQFLDIKDISELLKVKESTLRAWVFQKRIPTVRVGALVRFRLSDIEKWIKSGEARRCHRN